MNMGQPPPEGSEGSPPVQAPVHTRVLHSWPLAQCCGLSPRVTPAQCPVGSLGQAPAAPGQPGFQLPALVPASGCAQPPVPPPPPNPRLTAQPLTTRSRAPRAGREAVIREAQALIAQPPAFVLVRSLLTHCRTDAPRPSRGGTPRSLLAQGRQAPRPRGSCDGHGMQAPPCCDPWAVVGSGTAITSVRTTWRAGDPDPAVAVDKVTRQERGAWGGVGEGGMTALFYPP